MLIRLRSWWQKNKRLIIALVIIGLLILFALAVYVFGWDWTGLGPYISPPHSKDSDFQRGKTLWDWMQLLFVPALLTLGALWFTARQNHDREIAVDSQHEEALQAYIDKMSELLLEKNLRSSKPDDEVRNIATARTLTVLPNLDSPSNMPRKRTVIKFLHDARLIAKGERIVDLKGADLSEANLRETNLQKTDLSGADLSKADLSGANLRETSLRGTKLRAAHLVVAYLSGADLRETDLSRADLSEAFLSGADLSRADLSGATITLEQVKTAKSLQGTILPDGLIPP